MRDYGRVHATFWSSQDIRSLSEDARTLAFYLLTSPHTTIVGAFRLPDGYVSEDLQWVSERVREAFAELFRKGFANRCESTKWVWIRKFLEWNSPENPNQWKAARKIASQIPDECAWVNEFKRVFSTAAGDPVAPDPNRSVTVTQTVSKSGSGSGVGTEAGTELRSACGVSMGEFAKLKSCYPEGTYRQSEWLIAERDVDHWLSQGHDWPELHAGVERYALQCRAGGRTGTNFVLSPSKFFARGPAPKFLEPFPLPAARAGPPTKERWHPPDWKPDTAGTG